MYFLLLLIIPIVILLFLYYNNRINPHKVNNIREMYAEGLDMLVSGKRVAAYNNFKNIVDKDSNNVKSYIRLGQVLREGGNPVKALKIHKSLLMRKKISSYELIELHKNLSLDYLSLKNHQKSINEAKKILEIENENEWAIIHLISLYKKLNNWQEATDYLKTYFSKVGKKDNHKLSLYKIQNARVQIDSQNFDRAREILERVLNIDDSLPLTYFFIGKTYSEESSVEYDKAIELDKSGLNSMVDKEQYNLHIENAKKLLSKSIPMWVNFLELAPDNSWLVLPLIKDALFAIDRYSELEEILIKLIEKYPENLEVSASLADYYSNKGELSKAVSIIEKSASKNEDSILMKLIKLKLTLQENPDNKSLIIDCDDIINAILKDTNYQMNNDKSSNSDIKWIFENNEVNN